MARGGKRKGAGRPKGTGKFGEPTKAVRLPISMIGRIMKFIERGCLVCSVGPDDETLDLMDQLLLDSSATYYVRMDGQAMTGSGIFSGDLLIVDRNREPKHGDIVVAALDGKYLVRRLQIKGKKIELKAENPKFKTINVTDVMDFNIWGIVTRFIRDVKNRK